MVQYYIDLLRCRYLFVSLFPALTTAFGANQTTENDTSLFVLDSVYYRYQVMYSDTSGFDSLFTAVPLDTQEQEHGGLRISGTKDFSYDIDQGFDQGLKVNIAGEIEGVRIEGNLTDKATPSSTIQISDVDQISLQVITRNFYGGVGNLTLDLPFGIQDEIQGGRIGVHAPDRQSTVGVSYAVNRGTFKRMRFNGEEGKQSPYFLEGSAIVNSERIYVADGIEPSVLLKRDEDYTIDYERGIISFTNQIIITYRSRIEVEYQEAIDDYPNIYVESDGRMNTDKFVLSGIYRRKYDAREDPLTFTLSQAEIESLKTAGDSLTVLHTYADTSSDGDYVIENDHFVFVGEGNGDYRVTFFYVGENNGEYAYDPQIKAFLYQGPGLGNYSPTRFTPLPEQDEFYGFGMNAFDVLGLSIFGSQYDKNTFSSIGDDDNSGIGYHAQLGKTLGFFTINGEYIYYNERLTMPQGKEQVDYQYQWNTEEPLNKMGNVGIGLAPTTFLNVDLNYGILNSTHKKKSVIIRPFFFSLGYQGVDDLDRYFAGIRKELGKFSVKSRYENFEKSHLFNCDLKYSVAKNITLDLSGSYDRDTTSSGVTTILGVSTYPISVSLGRRLYSDTTFLFGNALVNIRYKGVSLISDLQHSQRYSQKRDEIYLEVEEGKGNYVYDPVTGTYIEKEGGNYIKRTFLLQEFERVESKNYNVEIGYTQSVFEASARVYYLDEKNFRSNKDDLLLSVGDDVYDVDFNFSQDRVEDARYALYKSSSRDRLYTLRPSYKGLSVLTEIEENLEESNDLVREKRESYRGEIAYRLMSKPLVRPLVGYSYSKIFSHFFQDMDVRLRAPRLNLLLGLPLKTMGRIELTGELQYRAYNFEDVPFFFTATAPPGLTKLFNATTSLSIGNNTLFSFIYNLESPPDGKLNQNLRFQTKIRF